MVVKSVLSLRNQLRQLSTAVRSSVSPPNLERDETEGVHVGQRLRERARQWAEQMAGGECVTLWSDVQAASTPESAESPK